MTIYARSDIASVSPGGGCGNKHVKDGDDFTLDCPPCETAIMADPRLRRWWSDDPDNVPLTRAEESIRQRMQEQEDRIEARRRLLLAEQRAAAPTSEARQVAKGGDLSSLHVKTLQKMARDKGVDDSGSKADLVARLSE